jgi:hypothetical protein
MSNIVPKFRCKARAGKIILSDRNQFDGYITSLGDKDDLELTVKPYKRNRSLRQNNSYWGIPVKILSEELGYSKEEIHAILTKKFLGFYKELKLPKKDGSIDVELVKIVPSTTKLSTKEFCEFYDKIQIWASQEFSIVIPDPESIDF